MIRVPAEAVRNINTAAAEMPENARSWLMDRIWYVLAGICLLYYICITAYAGIRLDAGWLWPLGALLLAGTGYIRGCAVRGSVPHFWRPLTTGLWLAAGIAFALLVCLILSHMWDDTQQDLDYVIVLGAQVKKDLPSRSLRRRLEKALSYAEKHPDAKLILSGGQGSGEEISEAECMARWLREKGIAQERLILEDRSESTYENLVFSDRLTGCSKASCALVSNNFHIYRALELARSCGYEHTCALAARSEPILQAHYILRETAAIVKMFLRSFSRGASAS